VGDESALRFHAEASIATGDEAIFASVRARVRLRPFWRRGAALLFGA
jgi:hypothetical protein